MKLIAVSDFYANAALEPYIETDPEKGADTKKSPGHGEHQHPRHVHKGFVFEIGKGSTLKELSRPEQELVSLLAYAGRVGDANSKEVVDRVKADIELDRAKAKKAAELDAKSSGQAATEALMALITQLKMPKAA